MANGGQSGYGERVFKVDEELAGRNRVDLSGNRRIRMNSYYVLRFFLQHLTPLILRTDGNHHRHSDGAIK